jgi:serine/threonine protein kinase
MKIYKKNTFTDLYIQHTVGISGEIQVFKLKLKKEFFENPQLRAHFISNAKALKNCSGKHLLTFTQIIDNEQETAAICQAKNIKSLPEFLAKKKDIEDYWLATFFTKMAMGVEVLHQSMLYHSLLQPSSFFVGADESVQLSLFDILEFRMYQFQQLTPDPKQSFINYLSPERASNFFQISSHSDIYALGLIYWHVFLYAKSPIKNWKLISENKYYSPTETPWDPFFETCFADQTSLRFKNIAALIKGLPSFNQTPPLSSQKKHPGYFTIRNLDPTRYRVKINGQEQPTSHMSGNELIIAISVEHVVVEIVDKTTNVILQAHDTRINKTYVMSIQGGNSHSKPQVNGEKPRGSTIVSTEEPKKKSKTVFLVALSFVFLLAGLAITGWQLGWFEWGDPAGTSNAIVNSTDNTSKKNEIVDTSKTVKSKVETKLPSEPKPIPLPSPKPPDPKPPGSQPPKPPKQDEKPIGLKCDDLLRFKSKAKTDILNAGFNKGKVKTQKIIDIQKFSEKDCQNCPGGLTFQSVVDYINGL